MVFSSVIFLFWYLPAVLAVYYLIPRKYRNLWLFAVNLVFYGWGEPVYIFLMLFSVAINYVSGRLIALWRQDRPKKAKAALIVNTAVNLLLLIVFKYSDLLVSTFNSLFGAGVRAPGLALPIGISFYTFQSMSYPIDVYRGDAACQRDFIKFGTFVSLFPQLIAGPIVRYKDIADRLEDRRESIEQFSSGAARFAVGLGKKVLLANNIGALWDRYAAASSLTLAGAWLGALAFSLQLYFDFSGYSDMAIGLGRMLGFEFLENFRYPYISRSVTEFWRRWHISLGTWFRDYLYIPLGGNRRGLRRQLLNILIVWSLTGLWHGANWTFLLWGLYYAFFLILEKVFLLRYLKRSRVLGRVYTLTAAVFGWVLFQLDSPGKVFAYWKAMLGLAGTGLAGAEDLYLARSFGSVLLISVLAATPLGKRIYDRFSPQVKGAITPVLIITCLAVCTAYLVDATYNPFLYFRF